MALSSRKLFVGFGEDRKIELDYDAETEIQLLPTCVSCKPYKVDKKKHYIVECWSGIERFSKCFPYKEKSEEEALAEANTYILGKNVNNIDTIITCKIADLTPKIIEKFRFCQPRVEYPEQAVPLEPRYIGLWLGDGTSRNGNITNIDQPIIDYLQGFAEKYDIDMKQVGITYSLMGLKNIQKVDKMMDKEKVFRIIKGVLSGMKQKQVIELYDTCGWTISKYMKLYNDIGFEGLENMYTKEFNIRDILKGFNLLSNKHIPKIYLENSSEVRCQVLAGLIDSDGYKSNSTWEITQKNEQLANDIVSLSLSLGFYTTIGETWKSCANSSDPQKKAKYHRIYISINQVSLSVPLLLERKQWVALGSPFYHNPKIWFGDNNKRKVKWTPELDMLLLKEIRKYEGKTHIEWKKITESVEVFKNAAPDSLRSRYKDINTKNEKSKKL